jgi:DNA end-binding protein Ku
MARALWRGTISFGLVTIPVSLMPAVAPRELSFHLLDGRDMSPVHNKRVNVADEEVPWERVVKGYELPEGGWVTITDEDFRAANVSATQTIDVLGAVCADDVPLPYFDTPYFLAPEKPGAKAYALLREALKHAGRIAIGQVVIRTRQHLCALVPSGDLLLLEVMRYSHELRQSDEIEVPGSDLTALGVTDAEIALAEQLVATIETSWDPSAYRDSYHDDLLALIERKAAGEVIEIAEQPAAPAAAQVIDIAELLKRSVEEARSARAGGAG